VTERETTSWWLRPARGFGLALSLTVSAAIIFGFVGALGWMVGVPLRWTAAFVGAVCALEVAGVAIAALLRRYVGVSGDVPAILTGEWRRQAERYGGPPAEVVPFLDGLSVARRPKVPHRLMAVLLLAGAKGKRYALPNSRIMIHQPLGGARGQATDIEIQAKEILRLKARLIEMIAKHTGQPLERIEKDADRDFFMGATEAKAYGLIDEVLVQNRKTTPPKDDRRKDL
jgi:hypothetical protein